MGGVDSVFGTAADLSASARAYLASPGGRRIRHRLATVVIIGAPILSELLVRRSKAARLLRTAAVGTLIVRGPSGFATGNPRAGPGPRSSDGPRPVSPEVGG
jgi:hypothetical protein